MDIINILHDKYNLMFMRPKKILGFGPKTYKSTHKLGFGTFIGIL